MFQMALEERSGPKKGVRPQEKGEREERSKKRKERKIVSHSNQTNVGGAKIQETELNSVPRKRGGRRKGVPLRPHL